MIFLAIKEVANALGYGAAVYKYPLRFQHLRRMQGLFPISANDGQYLFMVLGATERSVKALYSGGVMCELTPGEYNRTIEKTPILIVFPTSKR